MKRIALLSTLAFLTACPNPADEAPKAKVKEATEAPGTASKPAAPAAKLEQLTFGPASKIEFVGSKVTGSHDGGFEKFSGSIKLDEKTVTNSKLHVEINLASVYTDSDQLTGHLKSPEFFDVAKFTTATFDSTKIVAGGEEGTHTVSGVLDFHGMKKEISFPATVNVGANQVTASSQFALNRKDFGVSYPGQPDDLIRDEVLVKLSIEAARAK